MNWGIDPERGMMTVSVDGSYDWRKYSYDFASIPAQPVPELRDGEEIVRTVTGDIYIITVRKPGAPDEN